MAIALRFFSTVFLWAFAVFLFSPSALASSNSCQNFFHALKNNYYIDRIEFVGRPIFPIHRYAGELANMDRLIYPLQSPKSTRYRVVENGRDDINEFSHKLNFVQISDRTPRYKNLKDAHPNHELAYLYHENGHAIFEHNLLASNSEYQRAVKYIEEGLPAQRERVSEQIGAIKERLAALEPTDIELKAKLSQEMEALKSEFQKLANATAINFWRSTLHEAFADIVAVTVSRDPRSIWKLFPLSGKKENHPSPPKREFLKTTPRHLSQWKADLQKDIFPEPYSWILPVRWAFWDTVHTRIASPNYQKQVLPIVFKILSEEFSHGLAFFERENIYNQNFIPKDFFLDATKRISERFRNELP